MNLTDEQKAVVGRELKPGESLCVQAFAGTGKTSTLLARAQARDEPTLYMVFNKAAAVEASSKFPTRHVKVSTVHALAYAKFGHAYRSRNGGIFSSINPFQVRSALKFRDLGTIGVAIRALEAWQNSAERTIEPGQFTKMAERARIDVEALTAGVRTMWTAQQDRRLGMTHSGYMKLYQLSNPVLDFGTIMLDEAQDTNPVTLDVVMAQVNRGSRLILVGDPLQAIYGWRGASNAMETVKCDALSLTASFRFGPEIATLATTYVQKYLGDYPAIVGAGGASSLVEFASVASPATLVTRNNAEQITVALRLLTKGNSYRVGAVDLKGFESYLGAVTEAWHLLNGNVGMCKGFLSAFGDFHAYKHYCEVSGSLDRLAQISTAEAYADYDLVGLSRTLLGGMVSADRADLRLVTAHKAKGSEWDNVIVSQDFTSPDELLHDATSAADDQEKQALVEEMHLQYVAITRAKRALCYPHADTVMEVTPPVAAPTEGAPTEGAPTEGVPAEPLAETRLSKPLKRLVITP